MIFILVVRVPARIGFWPENSRCAEQGAHHGIDDALHLSRVCATPNAAIIHEAAWHEKNILVPIRSPSAVSFVHQESPRLATRAGFAD